jgi:hypothetical protein
MRTAIFVYKTTSLNISTCESDLQICGMNAGTVPLSQGENAPTLDLGIYKIVSNHKVQVSGDTSAFEIVVDPNNKTDIPTLPPSRASVTFSPLDVTALQAFFAEPAAKDVVNP